MKTVFQTDRAGYFVGVTQADESPLEPGVWLIPAGCVLTEPGPIPEGYRARWDGSQWTMEAIPLPPIPPAPEPPPAVTYKADIWRRATPSEAQTIDAQIEGQPVRERNLFRDAQYLDHSDPYFADLKAGFVAAFGPIRAGELLAPSE